jgi:CCR4-NOT transcription complex subunit 1
MRLPDPFTPNLKIEQLPEIIQTPKGMASTLNALATVPFKKDLDSYLRTRSPVTFLSELRGHLQQPNQAQVDGGRYNIPLMNALVLYVGQAAIQTITPRHINMTTIAHSSHMDIFQNLAVDLDSEGMCLISSHCLSDQFLSTLRDIISDTMFRLFLLVTGTRQAAICS